MQGMTGMKISIERGTLLKAVGQAQSVVERRNTIPILANVLIEAEGAQLFAVVLQQIAEDTDLLGDGIRLGANFRF